MNIAQFSNGVRILNCTAHDTTFQDGQELVVVPPSGYVLNANLVEQSVSNDGIYELVHMQAQPNPTGEATVKELRELYPDVLLVGSLLAAQAYEGVVCMVPVPGFERVEASKKRMRIDKFTVGC